MILKKGRRRLTQSCQHGRGKKAAFGLSACTTVFIVTVSRLSYQLSRIRAKLKQWRGSFGIGRKNHAVTQIKSNLSSISSMEVMMISKAYHTLHAYFFILCELCHFRVLCLQYFIYYKISSYLAVITIHRHENTLNN